MAIVELKTPAIKVFEFRQEKSDEDYGSCMWARFYFDTENYNLSIESDCGTYGYGWCPTPNTESFLKLCSRINADYLLEKLSDRSKIDNEKTFENIKNMLTDLERIEVCKLEEYTWEEIESACNDYDDHAIVEQVTKALEGTPIYVCVEEYALYESIEKDYPANAKKIVQVFAEHIKPKIKEMLKGGEGGDDLQFLQSGFIYKDRSIHKTFTCSIDKSRRITARVTRFDGRGLFEVTK